MFLHLYRILSRITREDHLSLPIEDYAIIGDCHTAALISKQGSIDWLCFPHFDSGACFASLLGTEDHGHWTITPAEPIRRIRRRYRGDTLILETEFETENGSVVLIDFMTPRDEVPQVVRTVMGKHGQVRMKMELVMRLDYGSVIPWVRKSERGITAIAGPDKLTLCTEVPLRGEGFKTIGDFTVNQGQEVSFDLAWCPSHEKASKPVNPARAIQETQQWWEQWSARCSYEGKWRHAVVRSLIVLKALIFLPTGGMVAAPTTSLPEKLGGVRNWDYRFCWVRDATLTLYSMVNAGYLDEARDWR